MGGENPYIQQAAAKLPQTKFRVRFVDSDTTIEVDPSDLPRDHDGRPGSLLQIAQRAGIAIDHACGGVCACSTCHVVVKQGLASCNAASEEEEDMLDLAPAVTDRSRLACQCIPDGTVDIEVEIPTWNRNYAREGGH